MTSNRIPPISEKVDVCVYTYIKMYVYMCMYTGVCICVCIYVCKVCVYMCVYMYVHIWYMCVYTSFKNILIYQAWGHIPVIPVFGNLEN